MRICLILLAFQAFAQSQNTEARLGDASLSYINIEFSPDMKFMAWTESRTTTAYICGVDAKTGDLIPSDGRGFRVGEILGVASPQWGSDSTGSYLVTVSAEGRFLIVRPSSPSAATVTTLSTPANLSRRYPYASRLPKQSGGYLIYSQTDANRQLQLFYLDLANPATERQVTSGPTPIVLNTPSFLLTIYRWFEGIPVFSYGTATPANPARVQMREVDLSSGTALDRLVTNDSVSHIDDFPFLQQGVRHFVGGQNTSSMGAVYEYDEARQSYQQIRKIEPQSTLSNPVWATSFETFTWRKREYAVFQVLDNGGPLQNVNAEIWLTSVYDNSVLRRVSPATPLARRDPEFFLGESKVFLYYYSQPAMGRPYELRRVEAGLDNSLPEAAVSLNAASYIPFAAADSLATAFGNQNFSQAQMRVRDSEGRVRPATVIAALNGQISYLVPAGTAEGLAQVEIDGVPHGLSIRRTAPGIFTANPTGSGVPAAQLVYIDDGGAQRVQNAFRLNPTTGQFEPAPLNLGVGRGHTLVLYLTGIRKQNSLSSVNVRIGGETLALQYAGSVSGFSGLDQINVALPAGLRGAGLQGLTVNVDGRQTADGVEILLQL